MDRWITGVVTLTLLATAGSAWAQQADSTNDQASRDCVCIDTAAIRAGTRDAVEQARQAMARARDAMRRAGMGFPNMRVGIAPRVRLGIGIDYGQGARWDSVGVRVMGAPEGGPAAAAGLEEGDVITALDGRSLVRPLPDKDREDSLNQDRSLPVQRLIALLGEHDPGDQVEVRYLRDGKESTTTVHLAERRPSVRMRSVVPPRPAPRPFGFQRAPRPDRPGFPREMHGMRPGMPGMAGMEPGAPGVPRRWREVCRALARGSSFPPGNCMAGVEVAGLNPGLGSYFGTTKGVLVVNVAPSSKLGLQPGDVVLTVNGREVDGPGDLQRILASYRTGEAIHFHVRRKGHEVDVSGAAP